MTDEPLPGTFRPAENLPRPPVEIEPVEKVAKPSDDLVARYKVFQEATKARCDVVYHPCSAEDNSPSVAFPESRVVYVDQDKEAIEALKKAGCEAHLASALEFDPGDVDVLILLNPQIPPDIPSQHVVSGGYAVCNDYHSTASLLRKIDGWELKGVVVPTKDGKFRLDTEDLEKYWQEIETDEEWKAAPFSWGAENYDTAAIVVDAINGKKENILVEYKQIVKAAREQSQTRRKQFLEENPGTEKFLDQLENDGLIYSLENQQFVLDPSLPRKKGKVDDLFVFQKTQKPT